MAGQDVVLWKLADLLLNAVAVGITRQEVVARVKELEEKGATPSDVAKELKRLRDEAIQKLLDD